jgi:hypothetical protein
MTPPSGLGSPIIGDRPPIASPVRWLAAACLAVALAACGRGGDWRTPPPASEAEDGQAGYVAPPRFTFAARLGDGEIEIVGRAQRNASVRLASPDGTAYGGATDSRGAFSVAVPAAPAVRLFGLSEDVGGRKVQGEGYLAVLPGPGRAGVLLRAGIGALAPGPPPGAPQIITVDFDAGGGAVASGLARPGTALRLVVDGATGGEARADAQGRYAFALADMLKPGDHTLKVLSAGSQATAEFTVRPASPISGLPFRAARQGGGWRIDWLTPGGGPQTTLIMD